MFPSWPDAMIEDYLNILEDTAEILAEIAAADDKIVANEENITKLQQLVADQDVFIGQLIAKDRSQDQHIRKIEQLHYS